MLEARKAHYQRQSSDESYSSTTSPSKTHRRTSSFIGQMGSGVDDLTSASFRTMHMNPVELVLSQVPPMMDCCSPPVQSECCKHKPHEEEEVEDDSLLELIRQLSFSPPRPSAHKTKKRTNTAETCETFTGADTETDVSSSEMSDLTQEEEHNSFEEEDDNRPIGLVDLQQLMDLRMASPSPLVGLQFLPDGYSYI